MKIKVGHRSYEVLPLTEKLRKRYGCGGLITFREETIHLQAKYKPAEQARYLLHELTHAIYASWGVTQKDEAKSEEDVCLMMDCGLATIFQDNPELLGVLHQALSNNRPIVG